ncbi:hypothetical protein BKA93DRAFT_54857 [Sparassis latifolia]
MPVGRLSHRLSRAFDPPPHFAWIPESVVFLTRLPLPPSTPPRRRAEDDASAEKDPRSTKRRCSPPHPPSSSLIRSTSCACILVGLTARRVRALGSVTILSRSSVYLSIRRPVAGVMSSYVSLSRRPVTCHISRLRRCGLCPQLVYDNVFCARRFFFFLLCASSCLVICTTTQAPPSIDSISTRPPSYTIYRLACTPFPFPVYPFCNLVPLLFFVYYYLLLPAYAVQHTGRTVLPVRPPTEYVSPLRLASYIHDIHSTSARFFYRYLCVSCLQLLPTHGCIIHDVHMRGT